MSPAATSQQPATHRSPASAPTAAATSAVRESEVPDSPVDIPPPTDPPPTEREQLESQALPASSAPPRAQAPSSQDQAIPEPSAEPPTALPARPDITSAPELDQDQAQDQVELLEAFPMELQEPPAVTEPAETLPLESPTAPVELLALTALAELLEASATELVVPLEVTEPQARPAVRPTAAVWVAVSAEAAAAGHTASPSSTAPLE